MIWRLHYETHTYTHQKNAIILENHVLFILKFNSSRDIIPRTHLQKYNTGFDGES